MRIPPQYAEEPREELRVKPLLAILGGFVVSLGMFAAGLAAAIYLLAVEPARQPGPSVDVADLWTAGPRKVDRAAQHLEHVPAQASTFPDQSAEPPTTVPDAGPTINQGSLDAVTTGSVEAAAGEGARRDRLQPPNQLSAAHVEWCAARYRSYRPDDNSYTSYSGGQQPCVSPYTRDLAQGGLEPLLGPPPTGRASSDFVDGSDPVFVEETSPAQYASDETAAFESDHMSYCFSRYRSYRPEDNTYQPFGGGPRRQCR
jgi:BA14K-like protein